jgi:hypothetical protein
MKTVNKEYETNRLKVIQITSFLAIHPKFFQKKPLSENANGFQL